MDAVNVTEISPFGSEQPVRWDAFCDGCRSGRSFGSEEDLGIWTAAHEDACGA